MYYIRTGIIATLILFGIDIDAHSQAWQKVGEKNGTAMYYSNDGKGYYRKISEEEIAKSKGPQVYIVVDYSGYFLNHFDEEGGGGSYSYGAPEGLEEYYESNGTISHIEYYPETESVEYDYDCNCNNQLTDEEKSRIEISVSALYPMYWDNE